MPDLDDDKAIRAIIPALKNIFKNRPGSISQNNNQSYNLFKTAKDNITLPITMIQTLLYENFNITSTIMDKVAVEVVDYIQDIIVGDSSTYITREQTKKFEEV